MEVIKYGNEYSCNGCYCRRAQALRVTNVFGGTINPTLLLRVTRNTLVNHSVQATVIVERDTIIIIIIIICKFIRRTMSASRLNLLGKLAAVVNCSVCLIWLRINLLYIADRDWEDMKKMPEHQTLVKDFKKIKYSVEVLSLYTLLLVLSVSSFLACNSKIA